MARVAVAVGSGVGTRGKDSPTLSRLGHADTLGFAREHSLLNGVVQGVQHRPRSEPEEGAGDLNCYVHSAHTNGRSYFTISAASIWLRMWPRISRALEPVPIT